MKELMKIIGMKMVYVQPDEADGIVELTLAPKDMVKKKPMNIMDLAGGDLSQLVQEVGINKKFETKIYIGFNQYLAEIKNQPLSDVWLELTVENYAMDIEKQNK